MPLSAGFIHSLMKSFRKQNKTIVDLIICSEIEYDSDFSSAFRQVSVINEEPDELPSPIHRSNYALDFRQPNNENLSRTSIEQNIKGFVDSCVRSSIQDMSRGNKEADSKCIKLSQSLSFHLFIAQDIVEVEVEYDPILGNVKSTRKRSSTIITKLDNDYPTTNPNHRHQSVNNRFKPISIDSEQDTTPIWARRRVSHSTVKPSDLIREYDKKEKLEPKAFRRLSRAGKIQFHIFA